MKAPDRTLMNKRYQRILTRISLLSKKTVLIAVSKNHPITQIEELYHLGQRDFGENYVQELNEKASNLASRGFAGIRWHFIGHLQTNKIKDILNHVSCIHTIDSVKLAIELSKRWASSDRAGKLPVFIQVNIDREDTKSGFSIDNFAECLSELEQAKNLSYQGLMCIPSVISIQSPPPKSILSPFTRLQHLELQCRPLTQGMLSMGMSEDFEDAIQKGATHIRVGSSLFGPREPK